MFNFKSKFKVNAVGAYTLLCTLSVLLILLSNFTLKVFRLSFFPQVSLTSGIILYPLTFFITDTITEVFGEARAKFCIWMGFMMNFIMVLFLQLVIAIPSDPSWFDSSNFFGYQSIQDYDKTFRFVFSISKEILIGSMAAYLVSQFIDIKIFTKIKKKTQSNHLWLRSNVSTLASQLVDSIIMSSITLGLATNLSLSTISKIASYEYLYKVLFTFLQTPLIYICVNYLKRKLSQNEISSLSTI